jgi:hypothetical protein
VRWRAVLVGCAAIVPALVLTGAADPTIAAKWHDPIVVVDGTITDWPRLEHVLAGPDVGVQNDDQSLYLAVATKDRTLRRQLATGLIVWLDGTAKRVQTFGVRLEGLAPRPLEGETPDNTTDVTSRNTILNRLDSFDLLGPAKNQRRLIDSAVEIGAALASGVEDGTVVYELKIPLEKSSGTPHAIGVKPGATIALGLETPADPKPPHDRNRLDDPMNTNPWVNDPYGGYFNPPPPPGAGSSESTKNVVLKPMKIVWVLVHLATQTAR